MSEERGGVERAVAPSSRRRLKCLSPQRLPTCRRSASASVHLLQLAQIPCNFPPFGAAASKMAHWRHHKIAQPVAASARSRCGLRCKDVFEPHLLLAWGGCLVGLYCWLHQEMDLADQCVFVCVHLLCLPMICRSMTPRYIACLGGPICGLIAGMQIIDLCFDLCIVTDKPLSDGIDVFQPRRAAFLYYHTMLNGKHVNGVLLGIILVSFLGSIVGLERSTPEIRQRWFLLGALMSVGTGGYLACAVTRYTSIRSATAFDERLFDGWEMVIAARLVLYVTIIIAMPFLFTLQNMKDGPEFEEDLKDKICAK